MSPRDDLFTITGNISLTDMGRVAERFRAILENSNDGLVVFDREFLIRYANPAACMMMETECESIVGIHVRDFLGDEGFKNIQDLCEFSKENESKICSNLAFEGHIGPKRHLEICIDADIETKEGFTTLYMSDQTRLNKAIDELCNRNAFLNNLIDSSTDGIIAADMKGRIILFSKGAQQLVGYTETEALAKLHVTQLYPEGEARRIMERLRSDRYGGPGRLMRHRLTGISKNGTEIPLSLSGSIVYDDQGHESATLGIFTDMRQIEKMERELKSTKQDLIQAEQMVSLGKLAAGVAHEINNPLTGILTFAEDLIEDAKQDDPLLDDYKIIHQEALRCREIVKNLLDFAKQEKLDKRPLDLNQIVMQTFSMVKRLASFRNIEITNKLQEGLPEVYGDPIQLQQVILNMMINSSEAMVDGGELYIATRTLDNDRKIDLSFSDTGPGIPLEVLKKIFEPFFSTKGGRTNGLGLSVSWGIVEAHGGEIDVETAQNQGTTFHVYLPVASERKKELEMME